jgi:hypothetical protein
MRLILRIASAVLLAIEIALVLAWAESSPGAASRSLGWLAVTFAPVVTVVLASDREDCRTRATHVVQSLTAAVAALSAVLIVLLIRPQQMDSLGLALRAAAFSVGAASVVLVLLPPDLASAPRSSDDDLAG